MSLENEKYVELLKPVYNDLLRYCKAMFKNGSYDDAEDLFQNTLVKSYRKFDTLSDPAKFKSWIFTIASREFISVHRNKFWKRFLPLGEEHNDKFVYELYDRGDNDNDKNVLLNALSKLNYKERSAILLFEVANFSIREIQEIQNEKSESAVKSRLSRVREKLRKYILENSGKNNLLTGLEKGDLKDETLKIISRIRRKGDEANGQVLG